jgi:hypothetical protein
MGQVRSAMALLGRVAVATAEMAGATTEAATGVAKAVRRAQVGSAWAAAGSVAGAAPAWAAQGAGVTAGFCRATVLSGLSLAATARDAGGMVLSGTGRAAGRPLMRLGRPGRTPCGQPSGSASGPTMRPRRYSSAAARSLDTCIWEMPSRSPISA